MRKISWLLALTSLTALLLADGASARPLDADVVLDLLQAGVSETSIRHYIERNRFTFKLSADDLKALKQAGASDDLILFLQGEAEGGPLEGSGGGKARIEAREGTEGTDAAEDSAGADYDSGEGEPDYGQATGYPGYAYGYYYYPFYYPSYYYYDPFYYPFFSFSYYRPHYYYPYYYPYRYRYSGRTGVRVAPRTGGHPGHPGRSGTRIVRPRSGSSRPMSSPSHGRSGSRSGRSGRR